MTDINTLRRILSENKRVAIVGLSDNWSRPSNFVGKYLLEHGFEVIPVNPKYDEILGQKCYADLKDIPTPVDIVDLFQRADRVMPFVDDAIEIGARVVWMQLGIVNEEAAQRARDAGLELQSSIGLHYNPFTKVYSLGPNVDVNYLMYFRRPTGE